MANKPCKNCIHKEACITANPDMVKKTYQCEHYISNADVVEVKHAYWIEEGGKVPECSNCRKIFDHKGDYCIHCGAKMDGGKENDR